MQTFYINPNNGLDTNNGLSWSLPFKTLQKALDSIGSPDSIIYISNGILYEGDCTFANASTYYRGLKIIGHGEVIMNSYGYQNAFKYPYSRRGQETLSFINMQFTGFESQWLYHDCTDRSYYNVNLKLINCSIYQVDPQYQITKLIYTKMLDVPHYSFANCTIVGLDLTANTNLKYQFNHCILHRNIGYGETYNNCDYNACDDARFRGLHGFDTTAYPPPLKKDFTSSIDIRFSKGGTHVDKYYAAGKNGQRIGATGSVCALHDQLMLEEYPYLRIGLDGIYRKWINDSSSYNKSFDPVTITSSNNKINFKESAGTTFTATIFQDTYDTPEELATAVVSSLEDAGNNEYEISYDTNILRFSISSFGSYFSILWNTGSDYSNNAAEALGFSRAYDNTGELGYTGISSMAIGPVDGTVGPLKYNTNGYFLEIDKDIEPLATTCKIYTEVIDMHDPVRIRTFNFGSHIDTSCYVGELEMRANDAIFNPYDSSATTLMDWSDITCNYEYDFDVLYRYWQFKMTLNTD